MINSVSASNKLERIFTRIKRQKYLLLMLAPAFFLTIIFAYVPLAGWYMAFSEHQVGRSIFSAKFTGLLQFKRFLVDSSDFIYLLRNTLVMNFSSIIVTMAISVLLAILLKELTNKLFTRIVQTVSLFPFFISMVTVYSIVWSLLSVNSGAINQFLVTIGVLEKGINLLGDEKYAWGLMVGLNAWKTMGYNCIIFLASISAIPPEQYESAVIDGAGRFSKIFYITLPHLLPTVSVLLILNSGWILNSSLEKYFLFTNPTNWGKMEVLEMYIYKFGLKLMDYSYATAVSIMKTIASVILIFTTNKLSKKFGDRSIF